MFPMRILAASSLVFCVLMGCGSPNSDLLAEQQKLLQRDSEWANLASGGKDVDRTASYWSDDAIIVAPGQPVIEGKAAIRKFVAESFATPNFHIHWKSEKVAFSPDRKLAYMTSTTQTTVPGPNGVPMTVSGRGITIWRREADGQWRCTVDIWNDPPPASP